MQLKFDLDLIIKNGDFDTDSLANRFPHLTQEGYFDRLEYFLQKTPIFIDDITNLKEASDKTTFISNIQIYNKLLNMIGTNKNDDLIHQIKESIKKDDPRTRNHLIKTLVENLKDLSEKTSKAYLDDNLDLKPNEEIMNIKAWNDDEAFLDNNINTLRDVLDLKQNNKKYKILAVDDMADVLNAVKAVLKNDYEVFLLAKPKQVAKFLQSHSPDLFLIDIEMPEMDGYELLTFIKSIEKFKNTPVIFLTSNATIEYVKSALDLGISDFVKKPFKGDVLLNRIKHFLI